MIAKGFVLNGAKMGIGLFHPLASVLILIFVTGEALHAAMLAIGVKKSNIAHPIKITDNSANTPMWELAKKYYHFPVYRTPQVIINAVSQGLPVIMLASFFGAAAAGFYALGKTVMGIPSLLVGKSVSDVFYPRITKAAHNNEYLPPLIVKVTAVLALFGFVPFAVVGVFGPRLFSFIFGPEWAPAGEYARWLTIWFYCAFLNSPSIAAIWPLSLQRFFLSYEVVGVLGRLIAILAGYYIFRNDVKTVAFYSVTGALLNLSLICCVLFYSKNKVFKKRDNILDLAQDIEVS
jgi:O-antigen/teichoic acid export membrane protein